MTRHQARWPSQFDQLLVEHGGERARSKRARVASACERCKTRKQKCDGRRPCSRCETDHASCKYLAPPKPALLGKNQYISSLERRVAELETFLSAQGMAGLGDDHWKDPPPPSMGPGPSLGPGPGPGTPGTTETTAAAVAEEQSTLSQEPDVSDSGDDAVLDWRDAVDPVVSVLRSLSLDVNGSGYAAGASSSHVVVGRLFSILGRTHGSSPRAGAVVGGSMRIAAGPAFDDASSVDVQPPIDLADVPGDVADRLFRGYLKHIATRFPVIHSPRVRRMHERRLVLDDVFEIAMVHLVYATAGRFIETTGTAGPFHAKRHYASAQRLLDPLLLRNELRTAQALVLMAVYCLRDPGGPGAWAYSRSALLITIDHGLHRRGKVAAQPSLKSELRKRLFWTCYAFDRQISIPTSHPLGISDRDINADLPLDVDEHADEADIAGMPCQDGPLRKSTTLTSFLMVVRIRQIESDIQQTVYRVDKDVPIQDDVIDGFLARLDQWKDMIPQDTQRFVDIGDVPYNGYESYVSPMADISTSPTLPRPLQPGRPIANTAPFPRPASPADLLLQVPAPAAVSAHLRPYRLATLPAKVCRRLRRHMQRLQVPAPVFCGRLLGHGAADHFHRR